MSQPCVLIQAGDLSAMVGDDTERGPGGRQYSGLWSLVHRECPASVFQAAYAGLIASAHRGTRPTLEPLDDASARLVRTPCEAMPFATVTGTYRLSPPGIVDYACEITFEPDAAGLPEEVRLSWCSYMNSPQDSSIHFIENNVWTSLTPLIHGEAATVLPTGLSDDHRAPWERRVGEARFDEQDAFPDAFSGKTFDYPFYFGQLHGMTLVLMADCHEDFRFFISPSGAGYSAIPGRTSPAWDFAWLVRRPAPGETRTLNVRLALFRRHQRLLTREVWELWRAFRDEYPTR